jgi:hypothetical protein
LADKLFSDITLLTPLIRVVVVLVFGSGGGVMVGDGRTVTVADEISKVDFPTSPAPTTVN